MVACFLLATRGLEDLVRTELLELPGSCVREVGYRRIAGYATPSSLSRLRLVDDVFLDLGSAQGVLHTRAGLQQFTALAAELPLARANQEVLRVRSLPRLPKLAISVSFVGRRNYSGPEIREAVAHGLVRQGQSIALVERDDEADLGLRLFIDHGDVHCGLRLFRQPAHQRAYQRWHRPGGLRAPIAAAMARLALAGPGMLVADPCCGTGTLLAEASALGAVAFGADAAGDALAAAQAAIRAQGGVARLWRGDAGALPLPEGGLDALLCNLPWDRQVAVDQRGAAMLHRQIADAAARALRPGGRAVLLTTEPAWLPLPGATIREISCSGARPQLVTWTRS